MITEPLDILQKYWGYTAFRPNQEAIIQTVLKGKDAIALLPTGGGKSICYQIPALAQEGLAVVISPLISLMIDQVGLLQSKGIKALAIPSGIPYAELDTLLDNCIYGNYKLLYLSPERLQQPLVQERLKQMDVSLIAIDEAHCISQWGHDFRPAYLEIACLREIKPQTPCLAVTATATPKVLDDIKSYLLLEAPAVFQSSYLRPNLTYTVRYSPDKYFDTLTAIQNTPRSVIIYVRSRKATMQLSQFLNSRDIPTGIYHGGLSKKERKRYFDQWKNNTLKVIVGTSAFGMGIDKSDVSLVIHVELPDSIENYYQEAGRAGRNGHSATALLLYNDNDEGKLDNQFLKNLPDVSAVKTVYKKLCNYFQISYGEGHEATFHLNFGVFCKTYNLPVLLTYNCLSLLDRTGVLLLDKKFSQRASMSIKVSDVMLTYYLIKNKQLDTVVKAVLRTYGGVFDQMTPINYGVLADKAGTTISEIHKHLLLLERDDIITYDHKSYDTAITFLLPREDDSTINVIAPYVKSQKEVKTQQIDTIKNFVKDHTTCRSLWLLAYFGEKHTHPCGQCDNCTDNTPSKATNQTQEVILNHLLNQPLNSKELTHLIPNENKVLEALKLLLRKKKITITPNNKYKLL